MRFNTAVSALMILVNAAYESPSVDRQFLKTLAILLAPFAPHLGAELWFSLDEPKAVEKATWPAYDPKLAAAAEVEIVIQVNGKLRGRLTVPAGVSQAEVESQAKAMENVKQWLRDKKIRKVVFVADKLINFVTR